MQPPNFHYAATAPLSQSNSAHSSNYQGRKLCNSVCEWAQKVWHNFLKFRAFCAFLCRGKDLRERNFQGRNFEGSYFVGSFLVGAILESVNARGANFNRADLSFASLRGADLRGATLEDVKLHGVDFKGAIFDEQTRIQLDLSEDWNEKTLDMHLNHCKYLNRYSILTAIDSIDDRYAGLKIHLAQQLIHSLKNVEVSSVIHNFTDIWTKEPYVNDEMILWFMYKKIGTFLSVNPRRLPHSPCEAVERMLAYYFSSYPDQIEKYRSAFVQTLVRIKNQEGLMLMRQLYEEHYLTHPDIQKYTQAKEFGDFNGKPAWEKNQAYNYILFSSYLPSSVENLNKSPYVILLKQHNLKMMLDFKEKGVPLSTPTRDDAYLLLGDHAEPIPLLKNKIFRDAFPYLILILPKT